MQRKSLNKWRLLSGTILLTPLSAFASDSSSFNQFSPPEGDAAISFLHEVFGDLITAVSYGSQSISSVNADDVLGVMMSVFNASVLFLSMLFVTYTTIKGVVDSAHDAEILGKKMSSVWIPLRTAAGTGLLLPLSSGYSFIQVIIIWLGVHGVGIADKAWTAAIDNISVTGMFTRPYLPNARPLVLSILRSQVCMDAMNKIYEARGDSTRITQVTENQSMYDPSAGITMTNITTTSPYQTKSIYWRATSGTYASTDNICGGITWQSSMNDLDSSNDTINSAITGSTKNLVQPLLSAHEQAVTTVISQTQTIADNIVAGSKPARSEIEGIVKTYEDAIISAAKTAVSQSTDKAKSDFLTAAKDGGFLYAGTWSNHIARLNDSIQTAVNSLPTSTSINVKGKENEEDLVSFNESMSVVEQYKQRDPSDSIKRVYYDDTNILDGTDNAEGGDYIKKLISAPFMGAINRMTTAIGGDNLNHMSQMKSFGDTLVSAGDALWLSMLTAAGVAGSKGVSLTAGWVFSPMDVISVGSTLVTMMVFFLMGFGVTLAVWVPMIPFVTWMTSCVNWFILFIEAILAAPIFAAAHVHPGGDEVTGKGSGGYMFILSLVMRPILMLFGLIVGMKLTDPITKMINTAFMSVVSGIQMGSVTGPIMFLGFVAVYVSISLTVVHLCYSLIHWIPDNVLRWINAASSALHSAENTGNQIGHDFKHSAGQAVNALQSSGVDSQRQAKDAMKQRQAAAAARQAAEDKRREDERQNSVRQAMQSNSQSSVNNSYSDQSQYNSRNQSQDYGSGNDELM